MLEAPSNHSTVRPQPEPLLLSPHSDRALSTAKGYPDRAPVPADLKRWSREMPDYHPPFYESPSLTKNDRTVVPGGWADPAVVSRDELLLWSRTGYMKSYEGPIQHDPLTGRPLNPLGRTGIEGRGLLGRWGPNHAADAILTRLSPSTGLLEVLLIQRQCGTWAIPGGMLDGGESPLDAARREIQEEAGVSLDDTPHTLIYQGIGDGPRTTDNAWIETSAHHFHLSPESLAGSAHPRGDSDALDARWMTISPHLIRTMYSNHGELLSIALTQFKLQHPTLPEAVASQLKGVPHVPLLTNLSHLKGRIGIFGGSFDPVHNSHIEIAERARALHNLDAVVFLPTGHNPLKEHGPTASPRERVEMLHHALLRHPTMFVSPLEARVPGVAYTVDTLEQLRKRIDADQCSLFLIIGGDSLHTLTRWKDYARLPTLAEIIPVERPGASDISHDLELREHLSAALGPDVATRILSNIVPYEGRALSSTELRTRIRAGESSLPMPTCVHHYCVKRGIYV